jgi:hypothetical protein
MQPGKRLINGIVLGAGAMYLLDPERGTRRRALLRDRLTRARRDAGTVASATARDLRNRSAGTVAQLRSRFRQDHAGDDVIIARVRSALGRAVSHPSAIAVTVSDGRVTLTGSVLERELEPLLRRVGRVRGATGVNNELHVYAEAGNVPELQGGRPRDAASPNLTPSLRLTIGIAGAVLALRGFRRGGVFGTAAGVVGAGLIARAAGADSLTRVLESVRGDAAADAATAESGREAGDVDTVEAASAGGAS